MPRPKSKPTPAPKRGRGQPEKEIDLNQLALLCQMQCTDAEIAAFFSVSRKTIERRKSDADFREVMEQGKLKGLVSLRQAQFKAALGGNTTMMVWLGKQLLGQRDKFSDEPEKQSEPVTKIEYKWVTPAKEEEESVGNPKLASDTSDKPEAVIQ